jgi:hypothetical protein
MDDQYPSAGCGEASEFRPDDLFNVSEALQKHSKIDTTKFFVVGAKADPLPSLLRAGAMSDLCP